MDKEIFMKMLAVQMQRIDFNKIPCNFEFKDNDEIFYHLNDGYFAEYPNDNLRDFMFGDIYRTFKFVSDEKS